MDLDNFPVNETAKRMLAMISPIYDKSYVGKWIFEVMGTELGAAVDLIRSLVDEAFPDTATWTIQYWEQMYGIESNPSMTLEERRKKVLQVRNLRRPMNPARIEQLIAASTGCEVTVRENTAPFTYEVVITPGEGEIRLDDIEEIVREVKQSNKHVDIVFEVPVAVLIQAEPGNPVTTFPYVITGTKPDVNIVGAASNPGLAIESEAYSTAVAFAAAGTTEAGTIPDSASAGAEEKHGLTASATSVSEIAVYPVCGAFSLKKGV